MQGTEGRSPDANGQADPSGHAIRALNVTKNFGHLAALRGASLELCRGEILALVGDNGAGKSTLMKILSGAQSMDSGTLELDGATVESHSMVEAFARGVYMVYQNLALAPDLTVSDMFFLGHEYLRVGWMSKLGVLDRRRMMSETRDALAAVGVRLPNMSAAMQDLSGGQRQALAVAKAMHWASTAILMDEPTAALGPRQTAIVYEAMRRAANRGLGVLVVSHDIPMMLTLASRIAVMRHGQVIAQLNAPDSNLQEVVMLMLGGEGAM